MKKLALLIITVLLVFYTNEINAQVTNSSGFSITGTVKGTDNVYIKLREEGVSDRTKIKTLDSVKIINGKFQFKGKVEHVDMMGLVIDNKYNGRFMIENSPISIAIDVTDRDEQNPYFVPVVSGSKSHVLYNELEEKSKVVFINPKYKPLDELSDLFKKAKQTKDQKDMDIALAKMEALEALSQERYTEYVNVKYNFARNNPSSPVAVHVLGYQYSEGRMTKEELKEFYNLFNGDARKTNFFKSYITKVYKDNFENMGVGNTVPDFTLNTLDGNELTLSKVNAKYKLVDFWASWCIPCRASFPHLKELRKQYENDDFEIVGVGTADLEDKWRKAIEEDQTPWLHVFDVAPVQKGRAPYGSVAKNYGVPHLPTTFLVDANNTILLRNPTKEELDAKLKELFGH